MRIRHRHADVAPPDSDELVTWISGLTDDDLTVRPLRTRVEEPGHTCAVCDRAATGEFFFGPTDHPTELETA